MFRHTQQLRHSSLHTIKYILSKSSFPQYKEIGSSKTQIGTYIHTSEGRQSSSISSSTQSYSACQRFQRHPKCISFLWGILPSHQRLSQLPLLTHPGKPSPFPSADSTSLLQSTSMGICLEGTPTYVYVSQVASNLVLQHIYCIYNIRSKCTSGTLNGQREEYT